MISSVFSSLKYEPSEDSSINYIASDTLQLKPQPRDLLQPSDHGLFDLQCSDADGNEAEYMDTSLACDVSVKQGEDYDGWTVFDSSANLPDEDYEEDAYQTGVFHHIPMTDCTELKKPQLCEDNAQVQGDKQKAGDSVIGLMKGDIRRKTGKQVGRMSLRPRKEITYSDKGQYQCLCCEALFEKKLHLRRHMDTCEAAGGEKALKKSKHSLEAGHTTGFHPCPKCSRTFVSLDTLLTHLLNCNPEPLDPFLPSVTDTKVTGSSNTAVNVIPSTTPTAVTESTVINTVIQQNQAYYICPKCNVQKFTSVAVLKKHMNDCSITATQYMSKLPPKPSAPGMELLQCRKCDAKFSDVYLFRCHVNKCQNVKEVLSQNRTAIAKYRAAITKKVNSRKFYCRKCGTEFPSFRLLNFHEQECILLQQGAGKSLTIGKTIEVSKPTTKLPVTVGASVLPPQMSMPVESEHCVKLDSFQLNGDSFGQTTGSTMKFLTEKHVDNASFSSDIVIEPPSPAFLTSNTTSAVSSNVTSDEHITTGSDMQDYNAEHFGQFICPKCDLKFVWKASFDKHRIQCNFGHGCPKCGARFPFRRSFEIHLRTCSSNMPIPGKKSEDKLETDGVVYWCKKCRARFVYRKTYEKHANVCMSTSSNRPSQFHSDPIITYRCHKCSADFTNNMTYKTHESQCTPGVWGGTKDKTFNPLECPACFEQCTSVHKMKKHKERCPYICKKCDWSFLDPQFFSSHVKFCHYRCKLCGVTFPDFTQQKNHIKYCSANKKDALYICKKCYNGFKNDSDLQEHELHDCPMWYVCSICQCRFMWKLTLDRHTMSCSEDHKSLTLPRCEICCMPFPTVSELTAHQDNCPLVCDKCQVTFLDPKMHLLHMKHCDVASRLLYKDEKSPVGPESHTELDKTKVADADTADGNNVVPTQVGIIFPKPVIEIKPEPEWEDMMSTGSDKCQNCDETFSSMWELYQHQLNCPFTCQECECKFPNIAAFSSHLVICNGSSSPLKFSIKEENDFE